MTPPHTPTSPLTKTFFCSVKGSAALHPLQGVLPGLRLPQGSHGGAHAALMAVLLCTLVQGVLPSLQLPQGSYKWASCVPRLARGLWSGCCAQLPLSAGSH